MSKQTAALSRQNNITRSDDKTNTHNQDKTILQDHMSKQTETQWRQNNITKHMTKQTPTQSRQQYYKITCQNKHLRNED